ELLTDNNDTTCYKNDNKRIEVNFSEPVVITWARVVFNKSALVVITALEFTAVINGTQVTKSCPSFRTPHIKYNSFDVFCIGKFIVKSVTLKWKGTGQVCSLYINAGRNVELGGAAVEGCNPLKL
ncbi:unnamed protein product, partial [Lymnaea stagnalis]